MTIKNRNDFKKTNLMTKVISIISAILLWSYVMSVVDPVIKRPYRDIPVTFQDMEDLRNRNLTIMEPNEAFITIELRGKRSYMDAIRQENIQASVSLKGLKEGEHSVPVTVTNYNSNVQVVTQDPKEILFTLDENVKGNEHIDVKTVGTLPDGYVLGEIKKNIDEVELSGPKSIMDKVNSVIVYVNIKDRRETTALSAPIKVFDDDMRELRLHVDPQNIDVEIPIYKTKTVPITLNLKGDPPENYEDKDLSIEPSTVTISGNTALVNKVKEIKTEPIYWSNIIAGETKTVELVEPEGIKLVNQKQIFNLELEETTISNELLTLSKPIININNLPEGYTAELLEIPESVKITLQGDKNKLANLKQENISLYIDGTKLKQGEQMAPLRTNIVDGIHVKGLDPSTVKCVLEKKKKY